MGHVFYVDSATAASVSADVMRALGSAFRRCSSRSSNSSTKCKMLAVYAEVYTCEDNCRPLPCVGCCLAAARYTWTYICLRRVMYCRPLPSCPCRLPAVGCLMSSTQACASVCAHGIQVVPASGIIRSRHAALRRTERYDTHYETAVKKTSKPCVRKTY